MTSVAAHAKLTLTLRVTGVRDDGFHLIDAEMVSLALADVRRIPTIATIARGKGKAAAVRAAIYGGLIDVLIVDPDLGRSLLT